MRVSAFGLSAEFPPPRLGIRLDLDMLAMFGVLAVTITRAGYILSAWEQADLRWVGYVAASVIDLVTLRMAYLWRRSMAFSAARRPRRRGAKGMAWHERIFSWQPIMRVSVRTVRLATFLTCAAWSGGVQYTYMIDNGANPEKAFLLSFIWPVLLVALAVNEGAQGGAPVRKVVAQGEKPGAILTQSGAPMAHDGNGHGTGAKDVLALVAQGKLSRREAGRMLGKSGHTVARMLEREKAG